MKTYTLYLFTGFQLVIELTVIGKLKANHQHPTFSPSCFLSCRQEEEYNHTLLLCVVEEEIGASPLFFKDFIIQSFTLIQLKYYLLAHHSLLSAEQGYLFLT